MTLPPLPAVSESHRQDKWQCAECGRTNHYTGDNAACSTCHRHLMDTLDMLYPPHGGWGAL